MLKRILPRTLLGRFVLIIVLPVVLLQAVTGYIFYERHWRTIQRYQTGSLAGEISMIAHLIEADPSRTGLDQLTQRARKDFNLAIGLRRGQKFDDAPLNPIRGSIDEDLRASLDERVRRPYRLLTDWDDELVRIEVETGPGLLIVEAPLKRVFSSTTYIFLMWMVGTAIVLLFVALAFMRNQVRPIRRLADAMDAFGKGRDVDALKPQGAVEVRVAATAFGRMQARLMRQIQQRTEMLAGVSHDLRTVLTRMRLETAMMGDSTPARELGRDITDMERMLEGYLDFAKGAGGEQSQPSRLGDIVEEAVHDSRRRGRSVELTIDRDGVLPVKQNALKRCLGNLIGNALAHADRVAVGVRVTSDFAEITVDDNGTGIPPERREEVFRPFFRTDGARNLDTPGVGLGLTIARDVARSHGGDLTLSGSPLGGLRATVRLPV